MQATLCRQPPKRRYLLRRLRRLRIGLRMAQTRKSRCLAESRMLSDRSRLAAAPPYSRPYSETLGIGRLLKKVIFRKKYVAYFLLKGLIMSMNLSTTPIHISYVCWSSASPIRLISIWMSFLIFAMSVSFLMSIHALVKCFSMMFC